MYQLKEKADKTSKLIELSKEKHTYRRHEQEALKADNEWGAAHLLSRLFFESEILAHTYITTEELNQFHTEFEGKEGAFDFNSVLNKCWIRIICGIVEMPSGIISAAKQYEKIKDAEPEFNFLVLATEKLKANNTITKVEFLDYFMSYQAHEGFKLSLDKCKSLHWLEDKDGKIKIFNLEYNKPIFQFKKELQFIKFLLEKEGEGNKYKLRLQYQLLENIHHNHKNFFSPTPAIEDLINQKVIIKEGHNYFLNLFVCHPEYWETLNSKIGFLLFSHMIKSNNYPLKDDLFKAWVLKMNFI